MTASDASAPRHWPWCFASAVLVYVGLRALIVVSAFDSVALWMYETFPIGALAELEIRGIDLPLAWFYDNAAGQILSGLMTVPAFLALGSSYLALKVVPFVLGLATLFLLFAFLRRHFGRAEALLGAWLFALAPTTVVKYSVIASGNHFENLFFTLLAVWAFYRLHEAPSERRRLFLSAYTAGLALFVFLGALIPIGTLAGQHLGLRGVRRAARDLVVAVPAFGLGILPLAWLNWSTGGRGLAFLSAKFGEEGAHAAGRGLERTAEFLTEHLPAAGVYEPLAGLSPRVLGTAFLACFLLAYAASLPEAMRGAVTLLRGLVAGRRTSAEDRAAFERAKLVPFVLYLPLAALAFGFSTFRIGEHTAPIEVAGYRYFLPHFLFATVLIAVCAAHFWRRGGALRLVGAAVAILPLAAGLSSFAIVDWRFERADVGLRYPGYDLSKIARLLLSPRNALAREEVVARVDTLPIDVRCAVIRGLGFAVGTLRVEQQVAKAQRQGSPREWTIDLREVVSAWPEAWSGELARGVGIAVRYYHFNQGRDVRELLTTLALAWRDAGDAEGRLCAYAAEGAAMLNPRLPLESETELVLADDASLIERCWRAREDRGAREVARGLARGQGLLCGQLADRGIARDRDRVALVPGTLPADLLSHHAQGLGFALAESAHPARLVADLAPPLPDEARRAFWWGAGSGLRARGGADAAALGEELGRTALPEERAELEHGLRGMPWRP